MRWTTCERVSRVRADELPESHRVRPPHHWPPRRCGRGSPSVSLVAETDMLKKAGGDLQGLMDTHKRVEAAADRVEALDAETGKRCASPAGPWGQSWPRVCVSRRTPPGGPPQTSGTLGAWSRSTRWSPHWPSWRPLSPRSTTPRRRSVRERAHTRAVPVPDSVGSGDRATQLAAHCLPPLRPYAPLQTKKCGPCSGRCGMSPGVRARATEVRGKGGRLLPPPCRRYKSCISIIVSSRCRMAA